MTECSDCAAGNRACRRREVNCLRRGLNADRAAMIRQELAVSTRRIEQAILRLAHGPIHERRRDCFGCEKLAEFFLSGDHSSRNGVVIAVQVWLDSPPAQLKSRAVGLDLAACPDILVHPRHRARSVLRHRQRDGGRPPSSTEETALACNSTRIAANMLPRA